MDPQHPTKRRQHDELFKLLLENFFVEFLELFVPDAARLVDRTHIHIRPQEHIIDLVRPQRRTVDLLVETRLRDEEGLILIHVETQSQRRRDYNEQMFRYFCALYQRYQKKILPVVVYAHDSKTPEPNAFCLNFSFQDVLRFQLHVVQLKLLQWRTFISQPNPVAAALLSKMGYQKDERVAVKVEFARMMANMQLDPAKQELLTAFFESYLQLDAAEERQYEKELRMELTSEEVSALLEITTSYHEKGRQEGELLGLRAAVVMVLQRCPDHVLLSNELEDRLNAENDAAAMRSLLERAVEASTVNEFLQRT